MTPGRNRQLGLLQTQEDQIPAYPYDLSKDLSIKKKMRKTGEILTIQLNRMEVRTLRKRYVKPTGYTITKP